MNLLFALLGMIVGGMLFHFVGALSDEPLPEMLG